MSNSVTLQCCTSPTCQKQPRVLCYCCMKKFCSTHYRQHDSAQLSRLFILTDEVNLLIEAIRNRYRQQLDRWRQQSHRTVDSYYETKCQEMESKIMTDESLVQNEQVLKVIQQKITRLVGDQDLCAHDIDALEAAMNAVKREIEAQKVNDFQLLIPPLVFDKNFIQIDKKHLLFNMAATMRTIEATIELPTDQSLFVACSSSYLLVCLPENLRMYDLSLKLIEELSWSNHVVRDLCYSTHLKKFLILADSGLSTLDQDTLTIEQLQIPSAAACTWDCCAINDEQLFLTSNRLGASVYSYILSTEKRPSLQVAFKFSEDKCIETMKCSQERLASIVFNDITGERWFDVRSTKSFNQIWILSCHIQQKLTIFSCCSLNERGWLINDLAGCRFIHVTNQGFIDETVEYHPSPHCALQWNSDMLVIIAERNINIHKIQT